MTNYVDIATYGAGQMGSRLVQGLLAMPRDGAALSFAVHVIDPSARSRETARSRALEVIESVPGASDDKVLLYETPDAVPRDLALAIFAATSRYRADNVRELLAQHRPQCVLLEKFLFDKRQDYVPAKERLQQIGATGFVHCPRGYWPVYRQIRDAIPAGARANVVATGQAYALASNCVHLFDLCRYLNGKPVDRVVLDEAQFRPADNKRKGYREIFGRLTGHDEDGEVAELVCEPGDTPTLTVTIQAGDRIWRVEETAGLWEECDTTGARLRGGASSPPLTSQNTAVFTDLLGGQETALPTLPASTITHLAVMDALLPHIGAADGSLPVT